MSLGTYDRREIHRIRMGDEADRTTITPHAGELIGTQDGPSPKLYLGDGSLAGGYLVGPAGKCNVYQTANQDIGTVTQFPWDTQATVTEDFAHSVSVSNHEVTAVAAGEFDVQCGVSVSFTGSACAFEIDLYRHNGSSWNLVQGGRAITSGTSGDYRQLHISRSIALLAGWKLRITAFNSLLTTGNTLALGNFCSFNISRIR